MNVIGYLAFTIFLSGSLARGGDSAPFDPPVLDFTKLAIPWEDAPHYGDLLEIVSLGDTNHLVCKSGNFFHIDSETKSVRFAGTLPIDADVPPYDRLIALAPGPDYETTGQLYTLHSGIGIRVVLRWHIGFDALGNLISHDEPQELYRAEITPFAHSDGGLAFGPEGMLYIALPTGESFSGTTSLSQDLNSPLGKILRIDVQSTPEEDQAYVIPQDNPFVANEHALHEIWATGLREPTSLVFDTETGDLFIPDSGTGGFSEINRQPAESSGGENYGWPYWDGTEINPNYIDEAPPEGSIFPEILLAKESNGGHQLGFMTPSNVAESRLGRVLVFGAKYGAWQSLKLFCAKRFDGEWMVEELDSDLITGVQRISYTRDGQVFLIGYQNGQAWAITPTNRAVIPKIEAPAIAATNAMDVLLSSRSPNSRIHYTTDGSMPDLGSAFVASGETIRVDGITRVRAIAWREDLEPSLPEQYGFYFSVAPLRREFLSGVYAGQALLRLETDTQGAKIRYTLDGTDPLANGMAYDKPIQLSPDAILNIAASKPGYAATFDHSSMTIQLYHTASVDLYAGAEFVEGFNDGPRLSARFSYELELSVDSSDRILIADKGNHRIRRIDTDGMVSSIAGGQDGFIDGAISTARFKWPVSAIEGPDGGIYVADQGNAAIRRISPDGQVTTVATGVGSIRRIFFSSEGELYWSGWGEIRKLNLDGTHDRIAGTGVNSSNSLAGESWPIWHDGELLVSSSNGIQRVDPDGAIHTIVSPRIWPTSLINRDGPLPTARHYGSGVARDPLGNLYLARGGTIGKWRVSDDWFVSLGRSFSPATMRSVAVTSDGVVYATTGSTIYRILQADWDDDGVPDEIEKNIPELTVGVNDLQTPHVRGGSVAGAWLTGTSEFGLQMDVNGGDLTLTWPEHPNAVALLESSQDLQLWVPASDLLTQPNELPAIEVQHDNPVFFRLRLFPAQW